MATLLLPTQDLVHYAMDVTLEGKAYTFDVFWNSRERVQHFTLSDAFGVICRFKPVLGVNLLEPFQYNERCPPGLLYAIASLSEKDTSPPDVGELAYGRRVVLKYVESA